MIKKISDRLTEFISPSGLNFNQAYFRTRCITNTICKIMIGFQVILGCVCFFFHSYFVGANFILMSILWVIIMISENKGLDMVWKLHAAVEVLEEQEKVMRKLHQQNNELTEENAKLHLEIKKLRNERKD